MDVNTTILFWLISVTMVISTGSFTSFPVMTADIEKMKKLAEIKVKILNKIGLHDRPSHRYPFPGSIPRIFTKRALNDTKLSKTVPKGNYFAEMEEFISHSQIPENFTDPNIILFKVPRDVQGRNLEVVCADLLVKIKYKRKKKKGNKKRKRMQIRNIILSLSSIDSEGNAVDEVSSLSTKLRRTKWLKMPVPSERVESAMRRRDQNLYIRLDCKGCDHDVKLILINGKRRKHRNKRVNKNKKKGWKVRNLKTIKIRRKRRLNKTRPFLLLHTKLKTYIRSKRDASVCNRNSSCCMDSFEVDFIKIGWKFVVAPLSFTTGVCVGTCSNSETQCFESKRRDLNIIYFDYDMQITFSVLRNMVVTGCGCQTTG